MNHLKVSTNPSLLRHVLNQAPLVSSTFVARHIFATQKRSYRFGRRVNYGGFYVSPKWFDQDLLQKSAKQPENLFGSEGIVGQTNRIFNEEKERQRCAVNRIEKIEIVLEKPFPTGEDYILMMNRNLSTPYDCASHISELIKNRSALAVVDANQYWHMHQPLEKSCQLRLLHYKHPDAMKANYAFWRSCSMLLASVVKKAFKERFNVQIISSPISDLTGGSFICDAVISNLNDWNASQEEIRTITSLLWDECNKVQLFERLNVNLDIAHKLFEGNHSRLAQIDSAQKDGKKDSVVVYRVGDHIDLCDEPLISHTNQIGSIYLTAIHPLKVPNGGQFYRFQGVALPKQLHINTYAFGLIRERAKELNRVGL